MRTADKLNWILYCKNGIVEDWSILIRWKPKNIKQFQYYLEIANLAFLVRNISQQSLSSYTNCSFYSFILLARDFEYNYESVRNTIIETFNLFEKQPSSFISSTIQNSDRSLYLVSKILYNIKCDEYYDDLKQECINIVSILRKLFQMEENHSQLFQILQKSTLLRHLFRKQQRKRMYFHIFTRYLIESNIFLENQMVQQNSQHFVIKYLDHINNNLDYYCFDNIIKNNVFTNQMKQLEQEILLLIKYYKLSFASNNNLITYLKTKLINFQLKRHGRNKCLQFALFIMVFSWICKELNENVYNVIETVELLYKEELTYSMNQFLINSNLQHLFSPVGQILRIHTSVNVLKLYQKLVSSVRAIAYSQDKIDEKILINQKDRRIFKLFNIQPHSLAEIVLSHYLLLSGIKLPQKIKIKNPKLKSTTKIYMNLKNFSIYDPLHFLLIKSQFWTNSFDRELLQISLWVMVDIYVKYIQKLENKEGQKKIVEYIKKLNISLLIFLLSLPFPTKILQYYPIEQDLLKDLFCLPIFPGLILKNKYFFKQRILSQYTNAEESNQNLEEWILPWSHLLTSSKTMLTYIQFPKGFQLAHELVKNRLDLFQKLSETIFMGVSNEFQRWGINVSADVEQNDTENKRLLSLISVERRKQIEILLHEYQICQIDRCVHGARRLLRFLMI